MPKQQLNQISDPLISHPRSLYGHDKSARQIRNGRRDAISVADALKIEESVGQPLSAVVLTIPVQRKKNGKKRTFAGLPPYNGHFI